GWSCSSPRGAYSELCAQSFGDTVRQLDVAQLPSNLLVAFRQAVEKKCFEGRLFARILVALAAQDPGVRDDRIGSAVRRIGNPNLQVVGNLCAFQGTLPAFAALIGQDELVRPVLQRRHAQSGQLGVSELDVANGAGSQLDERRNAVVALGSDR